MRELTLYHADYSTCSQKVRIVLAEKGLSFKSKPLNFALEEHLTPSYLALNPNGVVPTLLDNGDVIMDSSCIVEYLEECFPEPAMAPSTPFGRAQMRKWLRYMEEVPTTAIRYPSFQQVFLPMIRSVRSAEEFEASRAKRTLRQGFYGTMNQGQGFQNRETQNAIKQLRDTMKRMQNALQASKWLLGDQFSLVDATLAPLVDRATDLGMTYLWRDLPEVQRWIRAISKRPSFNAAFYTGCRLSERPEFSSILLAAREVNEGLELDQVLV